MGEAYDTHKEWFEANRPIYEGLTNAVQNILENLLNEEKIDFLSITSRAKTIESFLGKIKRKSYNSPEKEISDLAGIRVITFIETDIDKVSKVIESTFNVHPTKSLNKTEELGIDRVGYRSVHFVCDLGKTRCSLPEFSRYKDLLFEIQIRTVLQHAWAEIEHDRNYKFSGILPKHIQRRLYTLAGVLELVDREFTSLAFEVDKYKSEVSELISLGNLKIEINTPSISDYLPKKLRKSTPFSEDIIKEISFIGIDEVINELRKFGLNNMEDLDKILTPEVLKYFQKDIDLGTLVPRSYIGLLRTAMMYEDLNKYFEIAWNKKWSKMHFQMRNFFEKKYGEIKVKEILEKYNIEESGVIYG